MSIQFPYPDELIAQALSVQQAPPVMGSAGRFFFGETERGPLLPAKGTRERELKLRQFYYHDYNTVFRGAAAGLIKRVQSTPNMVVAHDADKWQRMIMAADFGDRDRFIAKVVSAFLMYDSGAWIEVIAPGDPLLMPTGEAVGFSVLDSLRCYPTGNPTYPVIYYDTHGKMHIMHHTRVVQFVDNPSSEEFLWGYGDCALSRAIAPVVREILIGRYVEMFLDDKPPPGVNLWGGLSEPQLTAALAKMERERNTDNGGVWGRTFNLYGVQAEITPTLESHNFTKAPEGFNYAEYKDNNVNEIALAIGMDKQDLWELSGGGIGTGTQSEILAQKSRGKAFGRILKGLERLFNTVLPERVEFKWEYSDPQEELEEAQKANEWANFVNIAGAMLSTEEKRLLLSNQVPAMKDVLIDADGNLKRLPDDDLKAPGEQTIGDLILENAPQMLSDTDTPGTPATTGEAIAQAAPFLLKSLAGAAADFERRFDTFVRVAQAQNFPDAIMRATFRGELLEAGYTVYDEGLKDGGAIPAQADQGDRTTRVSGWLALQNTYIDNFTSELAASTTAMDKSQISARATMWVNKSLRTIYYAGLHAAAGETNYRWQLGNTEESCRTCLTANGVVRQLKEWLAAGITPGSDRLECKGFNCDCKLSKTTEAASGRLPQLPSIGVFGMFNPLGSFLQRVARRELTHSIERLPAPDVMDRYLMRLAV